jgi:hypothetical protein
MIIKYPKSSKIYKHFPIQGPPKFTQIGIFGLKTNHLATLCNVPKTFVLDKKDSAFEEGT